MSAVGISSEGHFLCGGGSSSSSLEIHQLSRPDSRIACLQSIQSNQVTNDDGFNGSWLNSGGQGSSSCLAVEHGVAVFLAANKAEAHVLDVVSTSLLWTLRLPDTFSTLKKGTNVEDDLQVLICNDHFLVLWSNSLRGCWTAINPLMAAKAKAEQFAQEIEEAGEEGSIGLVPPEGIDLEITTPQASIMVAECSPVPLPKADQSVVAVMPLLEEEESRVSFVVITSSSSSDAVPTGRKSGGVRKSGGGPSSSPSVFDGCHCFTQAEGGSEVAFIETFEVKGSGITTTGATGGIVKSLSRRSDFYVTSTKDVSCTTSALYQSSATNIAMILNITVQGGEQVEASYHTITNGFQAEGNPLVISRATAINAQCWVAVGESVSSENGKSKASKKEGTADTPWIASIALDIDESNGLIREATLSSRYPLAASIATCCYDTRCDGVRLVRLQSTASTSASGSSTTSGVGGWETAVVPFPEREAIVLDTVEVLLQGVGLEDQAWDALAEGQLGSGAASLGFNAKQEVLYHYLVPTSASDEEDPNSCPLSILSVTAPQALHTKRGTNGKEQLIELFAAASSNLTARAAVYLQTWHPNAARQSLRLAGSLTCLALLRVVTRALRQEEDDSGVVLTPSQLRTSAMALAMHIVTLSRPIGLVIPAEDVETLYLANAQTRNLGPCLTSSSARIEAMIAAHEAQQIREAENAGRFDSGSAFATPASLKVKKYAYGNNSATAIEQLRTALPQELRATPKAFLNAAKEESVVVTGKSNNGANKSASPFLQYEGGALLSN